MSRRTMQAPEEYQKTLEYFKDLQQYSSRSAFLANIKNRDAVSPYQGS